MKKISITIDINKIPKGRLVERAYTDQKGGEVVARELNMELVPLREPKTIKTGETWKMVKTHFVSLAQTKEERASKTKTPIIGSGITFMNLDEVEAIELAKHDGIKSE